MIIERTLELSSEKNSHYKKPRWEFIYSNRSTFLVNYCLTVLNSTLTVPQNGEMLKCFKTFHLYQGMHLLSAGTLFIRQVSKGHLQTYEIMVSSGPDHTGPCGVSYLFPSCRPTRRDHLGPSSWSAETRQAHPLQRPWSQSHDCFSAASCE